MIDNLQLSDDLFHFFDPSQKHIKRRARYCQANVAEFAKIAERKPTQFHNF